jgi:predicted nucleic acid-binding protein
VIVLLDSSAWLEYFFGSPRGERVRPIIEDPHVEVVASPINVFEVYHRLLRERGKEAADKSIGFVLARVALDELDVALLKAAAQEKIASGLAMADALVATTATAYDAKLYTGDADFRAVSERLRVEFL